MYDELKIYGRGVAACSSITGKPLLRLTGLQQISVAVPVNYTSIRAVAMEVPTSALVDPTPLISSLLQLLY